jgi:hypothetical protein
MIPEDAPQSKTASKKTPAGSNSTFVCMYACMYVCLQQQHSRSHLHAEILAALEDRRSYQENLFFHS